MPGRYLIENRLHTVLRVVIFRTLVGRRTGPLTRSCLSFARLMRSVETGREFMIRYYVSRHKLLTLLQVFHVATSEGDADFVDFGSRNCCPCSIIILLSFGDVTHFWSQKVTDSKEVRADN